MDLNHRENNFFGVPGETAFKLTISNGLNLPRASVSSYLWFGSTQENRPLMPDDGGIYRDRRVSEFSDN